MKNRSGAYLLGATPITLYKSPARFGAVFIAIYLAAFTLLMPLKASAAEIAEHDISGVDRGKMIVVSGTIDFGDDRRFASIAAQARNGIVFFNSPGGSLDAAIQMGKVIRVMGLVTYVSDGDICVSACALAWLGGSARFMSPSAKVGFHAAYVDNRGEKEVSSVGNAIVGGYLNGLGFSENAIAYITSAPPEGVRWLTFDDAGKVGIEVKRGLESEKRAVAQPPTGDELQSKTARARAFILQFVAASSNNDPRQWENFYDSTVMYFGKNLDHTQLVEEYSTYVARWPYRRFLTPENELSVDCANVDGSCSVSMLVHWLAVSKDRNQESEGFARRVLTLKEKNGSFSISYFNEKILNRRLTPFKTNLFE